MKVTGRMICNMASGKRYGLIIQGMKVSILRERSTEEALMYGRMAVSMKGTGSRTELKVMEHTPGLMEGNTQAHGKTIICMVMAYTLGEMVGDMKDFMKWIKSMATEYINGLMEEDMRVIG